MSIRILVPLYHSYVSGTSGVDGRTGWRCHENHENVRELWVLIETASAIHLCDIPMALPGFLTLIFSPSLLLTASRTYAARTLLLFDLLTDLLLIDFINLLFVNCYSSNG